VVPESREAQDTPTEEHEQ
jgi:hypothetical protein